MTTVVNVISNAGTLIRMGDHIRPFSYHVWCSMNVDNGSYQHFRRYHMSDEYWQFTFDHDTDAVAFCLAFPEYVLKEDWFS